MGKINHCNTLTILLLILYIFQNFKNHQRVEQIPLVGFGYINLLTPVFDPVHDTPELYKIGHSLKGNKSAKNWIKFIFAWELLILT